MSDFIESATRTAYIEWDAGESEDAGGDFDRWLAEVKAEAWLEGYGKGFYELRSMPYGNGTLQNPYRGENK